MFQRVFISIILIFLAAGAAVAQPVTDPQTICFFFDEEATVRSYYGSGVFVGFIVVNQLEVDGHLAEHLERWTCTFYWDAEPGVVGNCDVWPVMGHPVEFPAESGSVDIDVSDGLYLPLNAGSPTVVAMVGFHLPEPEPVALFIRPGEFWADGGHHAPFNYLYSGPDGPMDITEHVANINGPAPVATDQGTWGGVKLLYR